MFLFDLILLIIVILCVIVGMRRGFVLTLCGLLAILIALVGAKVVADQFSPQVKEAIMPRIESAIEVQLNESVADTTKISGTDEKSSDNRLRSILSFFQQSENYDAAVSAIQGSIQSGVDSAVKTAAGTMATKIAQPTAWGVVYVIAFFVILLLCNLIGRALDLVARLPVLHFLNRILGGTFGLLKGMLIIGCVCYLILSLKLLPATTVQESAFLRFFSTFTLTSLQI